MSYIQFLCREGYTGSSIAVLAGTKTINCSTLIPGQGHDALNYPTFQLSLKSTQRPTTTTFRRRVTNVAHPVSVYNATIKAPPGWRSQLRRPLCHFHGCCRRRVLRLLWRQVLCRRGKWCRVLLLGLVLDMLWEVLLLFIAHEDDELSVRIY